MLVLFVVGPCALKSLRLDFGIFNLVLIGVWGLAFGYLLPALANRLSDRLRSRHLERLKARLTALAEVRKPRIDEAQAFYASPDWKLLRDEVIREQGHVCCACGSAMNCDMEVTVDHILPGASTRTWRYPRTTSE